MEKNSRIYATNGIIMEAYNMRFSDEFDGVKEKIDKWYSDVLEKEALKRKNASPFDDEYYYEEITNNSRTHTLSLFCEDLLRTHNSIEMSQWFKFLLTWSPENKEEAKLLCELLRSIEIKKISTSHNPQINYLRRVLDFLANDPNSPRVLYNRDLQERIEHMESEHNIFLDTPSDMRFRFKHSEILTIKSRTFKSLPRIKDIYNNYGKNNK